MSSPALETKTLAQNLLERERPNKGEVDVQTALRVCEKLRASLSTLAGIAGFQALLSRALVLSQAVAPELRSLSVNSEGIIVGIDRIEPNVVVEQGAEMALVLVVQLLNLLTTLIGASLVVHLVYQVWPDLPPEGDSE